MFKLKWIIIITICTMIILWISVINYHEIRKDKIREHWMLSQFEIVKVVNEAIKMNIYNKYDKSNYFIFMRMIDQVHLLNHGNAWAYTKNGIIYDPEIFSPEINEKKSIDEIFKEQEKFGAKDYENILNDIKTGSSGKGFYTWTNLKGREYGAWISNNIFGKSWTIGVTTPEKDIFEAVDLYNRFYRECLYALIITIFLFLYIVYAYKQDIFRKNELRETSNKINSVISSLDNSIDHLKEI